VSIRDIFVDAILLNKHWIHFVSFMCPSYLTPIERKKSVFYLKYLFSRPFVSARAVAQLTFLPGYATE
jgi:hypothetical protein